ncbi:hypothetical protein CYMTET_14025 [Cymbomonas tetramitiformis]|uniref:Uncharacterized protein n=1 Tax=Cymbomonas tetramitiformis TaxID=36881 RepID=A0AAE0GH78_9CHLO|nr:hypothetical protein CYMTET_14025 [Cymbomonas tetramitiformis]
MALCFEHRPLCHLCKVTNAILKSVFKLGPKKRPLVAVLFVCLFLIHQESASSQGTIPVAPTTVDADESIAGPRRQLLSCTDLPEGNTWHDGSSWGNCNTYYSDNLCTSSGGYGSGWLTEWGSFSGWTSYGLDATEACCVCGGGSRPSPPPPSPPPPKPPPPSPPPPNPLGGGHRLTNDGRHPGPL